ncbi:MAG: DMT family transporter [Amaricoccus sp.]|uniref:DMT family transporter n=1 Tax=Amaricoccus sp. TaxID=1872485 RepID=UPI0039E59A61
MSARAALRHPGVRAALAAALLFGVAAPLAKRLLGAADPVMLAGLLYLGSGIGLFLWRRITGAAPVRLPRAELPWLAGAILAGGVLGPVLLLSGLSHLGAAETSLLLNAEGVFTAVIAWMVFRENVDRRIALGMLAIVAGAAVIGAGSSGVAPGALGPSLLVLAACLAWGIDNNLTRQVSLSDATWIASAKGLVAGAVNLGLALAMGSSLPGIGTVAGALLLGFLAYGVSLSLFVCALRDLGTARTGAYFGVAPFFGAVLAVLLGEPLTAGLLAAGALMALGVWLHLRERHAHEHHHPDLTHAHWHIHDAHHLHEHPEPVAPGVRHFHRHRHAAMTHSHAHFPDAHHRHAH